MTKNEPKDNWNHSKKAITKLWFVLLVFNIFINIEAVETWIDKQLSTESLTVSQQLFCVTSHNFQQIPKSHQDISVFFAGAASPLNPGQSKVKGLINSSILLEVCDHYSARAKETLINVKNSDCGLNQGRAPPKAAIA